MASAKQIAWRKKFAKMAKSGKFRKSKISKKKGDIVTTQIIKGKKWTSVTSPKVQEEKDAIKELRKKGYTVTGGFWA